MSRLAVFLLGEAGRNITGLVITIDAGQHGNWRPTDNQTVGLMALRRYFSSMTLLPLNAVTLLRCRCIEVSLQRMPRLRIGQRPISGMAAVLSPDAEGFQLWAQFVGAIAHIDGIACS